jgi:hypothetical protein
MIIKSASVRTMEAVEKEFLYLVSVSVSVQKVVLFPDHLPIKPHRLHAICYPCIRSHPRFQCAFSFYTSLSPFHDKPHIHALQNT